MTETHVDAALSNLHDASEAIAEVGSLRQDEFRFWHALVSAVVQALLAIADRSSQPDPQ